MSKSLNNVINPFDLATQYPKDTIRYFLLRNGGVEDDSSFSDMELVRAHNGLADSLGNLFSRCSNKALAPEQCWSHPAFRSNWRESEATTSDDIELIEQFEGLADRLDGLIGDGNFPVVLKQVAKLSSEVNRKHLPLITFP